MVGRQAFPFGFRPIFRGEVSVLARVTLSKDLDWYHLWSVFGQVCKRYLQRLTLQHLLAWIPHKLSNPITNPTRPWVSYSKTHHFQAGFLGFEPRLNHSNGTLSDQHVSPTTLGNIRYIIYLPTPPTPSTNHLLIPTPSKNIHHSPTSLTKTTKTSTPRIHIIHHKISLQHTGLPLPLLTPFKPKSPHERTNRYAVLPALRLHGLTPW